MKRPRKVTIRKREDRGNKPTVYWREYVGGKVKQRAVTFDTMTQAKDFAAQKYLELRADVSPAAVPVEWARVVEAYLNDKRANQVTEQTIEINARALRAFESISGPLVSTQINQLAIDLFKGTRAKQNRTVYLRGSSKRRDLGRKITPATLNMELRQLKTFIRWMQRRNYNKQQIEIQMVRERKKIPRVLSDTEIDNLKVAAAKIPGMACRVAILFGTAQRIGAVEQLGVSDVKVEHNQLFFREKMQRDRVLPVSAKVMQQIVNYMAELPVGQEWLFHTLDPTGKTTSRLFPRSRWKKIVEDAGLDDVTPHDLRETCLSLLARNNVSAVIAQKLAGHSSVTTTMRHYVNADDDRLLRAAVEELPE